MQFDHHNMAGVRLAAALLNLPEPWDAGALAEALEENSIGHVDLTATVREQLHQLTGRLRPIFEATCPRSRCDAINRLLDGRAAPFLTMHDGLPPHLHFAASEDEPVERVVAFMAGSLAIFTVETAGRRLGTCARSSCPNVFVDTSLNGRRAYCSSRCANSDAVGRHRERKRATLPV